LKRIYVVTALVLFLGAVACGGNDERMQPTAETKETSEPGTKVVKHALGKTEIPVDPQRIVVLNPYALLDYLLALDVSPVGSTGGEGLDEYPFGYWLRDRTEGIEPVGGTIEPDLEKVAAGEPDLILSNPWQEDIYKELMQIAPTVAVPLNYSDYEEEFRYVAELVGRSEEAEAVIAAHHARLEEFREASSEVLEDTEVSVIRVFPDSVRIEVGSYVTTLLEAAAVERPHAQASLKDSADVSIEQSTLIDGDVILLYSADNAPEAEKNEKAREEFLSHALFGNLYAAKKDEVHVVDSRLWAGGGILWADAVVDDLTRILLADS